MVISVADRSHPHMFVDAESRFAEDMCGVEFYDALSLTRAQELAEFHADHRLDECPVLRAAMARLRQKTLTGGSERNALCGRGSSVFDTGVGGIPWHDCDEDPGPIVSVAIAVACADLTRECDPQQCRMHARVCEAFDEFGVNLFPPRECLEGAYNAHIDRVNALVAASPVVDVPYEYCRIDPGPVPEPVGRILLDLHHYCDEGSCRAKQRGRQGITYDSASEPAPKYRVPEEQIALVVDRVVAADIRLQVAKSALRAGQGETYAEMIAATADFASARRLRDALFLAGLPDDGTVPALTIRAFGMSLREVRRLVPGLRARIASPGMHDR
ncbi:hypothetical protein K7711_45590 [Nocardia sp. CA2R105]|uniref:hypothetical protein n=1 Tax=Nocardia coffeae TaxID=2873381 RepID=UPI001CA5FE6A|nr:hypothetical protein [Nocardia coffeae]MBY8863805.1 hypothetical protein [Nocardia coffeae]